MVRRIYLTIPPKYLQVKFGEFPGTEIKTAHLGFGT